MSALRAALDYSNVSTGARECVCGRHLRRRVAADRPVWIRARSCRCLGALPHLRPAASGAWPLHDRASFGGTRPLALLHLGSGHRRVPRGRLPGLGGMEIALGALTIFVAMRWFRAGDPWAWWAFWVYPALFVWGMLTTWAVLLWLAMFLAAVVTLVGTYSRFFRGPQPHPTVTALRRVECGVPAGGPLVRPHDMRRGSSSGLRPTLVKSQERLGNSTRVRLGVRRLMSPRRERVWSRAWPCALVGQRKSGSRPESSFCNALPSRLQPGRLSGLRQITRFRRSEPQLRGAPVGIRTPNLLIRSQMLYPLSYGRPPNGLVTDPAGRLVEDSRPLGGSRNQCTAAPAGTMDGCGDGVRRRCCCCSRP